MESITNLLNQLTKGGVWKWKPLNELIDIQRGFSFDEKKYKKSGLPIIKVLNVQKGKIDTEKLVYFSKEDYSRDLDKFLLKPGEVCITTSGASSGKIAFNNHEQDFYLSSTVCKLQTKSEVNPKYLYYSLLCFQKEIHNIVRGGAVKGLPIEQLKKLKIPLPPLEIQEQISEILDSFRELVRELEIELRLRKKTI
ncbi:putative type-1 restriction enzyme specificity protein MPN_089 [Candidatus Mycoplasma haematohominis]|uniref:Putative type-1 restriction enzyme specificity protein MPN_089 n=1 Tax=Candidatus Mycoplasma haematohominis TaxID=1494318 RepID=A0A478FRN1_9MOLU|nr:putative type-1 restriction enzyme specificity protein MPN_089 [Candidatus Mycoplasma haemohominis]